MSTLRISDAPLLPDVNGTEKIPTGGRGDYAISVDQIKDHIFQDVGKELVGLGNVDNTSDLDKPVSTAQQAALDLKADKTYVDTNLNLKADKANVYTRSETTLALSTKADLVGGVIPSNQLPSYVDDVVEYTTRTLPIVGESGKIYITTDTNRTWRWSGNQYVEISNGGVSDSTLKLQTPRKIANVDFDGTQDISIPHNNLEDRDVVGAHPASAILDSSGKTQQQINDKIFKEVASVADFGAKGDGDQTVYDVTPYKTDKDKAITITQQTADGIAFNAAIKWLRNRGGGSLYIPPCESGKSYRIWGYLESIDFPCVIYGGGANSLIQNCDTSPTDRNGYGLFVVQPKNGEEVSFLNVKLDGVADIRAKPTSEHRIYPIVIYGDPKFRAYGLTSVNSPIDCLNINFDVSYVNNNTFAHFVSCYFDNSYRNTVTCGKGENIKFTDCIISRGGWVHGGTQPRYCVDIEPNFSSITVKTQWVNCTFSHGFNVLVGGVWTESIFTGCLFDASFVHPANIDKPSFPWPFQMTAGRWDVDNCVFIGRSDYMQNQCHHFNAYNDSYAITNDSYLRIKNSTFRQCGLISTGRSISIENCLAQLSMCPFFFQGGTASPKHDIFIKNLRLVNVFDGSNYGAGTQSAFALTKSLLGTIDIDGLTCEVDSSSLNQIPVALFDGYQTQYGIWIPHEMGSNGNRCSIKNVHCEGYYNRLHPYLGIVKSTSQRRDWGRPNLPPPNTALVNSSVTANLTDGTVANNTVTNAAVTGTATQVDTIANRTLGGRTTPYYKDCTMWGDYA